MLRDSLQNFITSRSIRGEEPTNLLEKLLAATGGNKKIRNLKKNKKKCYFFATEEKDALILMLLPHALKVPASKSGDSKTQKTKKLKVESEEKKEALRKEREAFILHAEVQPITEYFVLFTSYTIIYLIDFIYIYRSKNTIYNVKTFGFK